MASRSEQRLTKRQQKLNERGTSAKVVSISQLNMELVRVDPMTENQTKFFTAYNQEEHICLLGCAGTGKTFISLYQALKEIADRSSLRRKLIIVRTPQPTKAIGFLPGDEKKKNEVYESAYRGLCAELYGRADAYEILKQKGIIEFHGTSFLRGTTIDNAIILIDEAQSQTYMELKTVVTRTGSNSRILICGDIRQDDLTSERYKEVSGLPVLLKVFNKMDGLRMIEFTPDDIVRSGFVKSFIEAEYALGIF